MNPQRKKRRKRRRRKASEGLLEASNHIQSFSDDMPITKTWALPISYILKLTGKLVGIGLK